MALRPPLRVLRLGNPLVKGVLRSPAHRLLSGALVVLEYEGRRTHRRHAIPVQFAEEGAGVVAVAVRPGRKQWWRTFRRPAAATLLLRGERRAVEGRLLEGAERRDALRAYLARFPRARPALSLGEAAGDPDLDEADVAVVAFGLRPG
jgi:hypothetical protein